MESMSQHATNSNRAKHILDVLVHLYVTGDSTDAMSLKICNVLSHYVLRV